MAYADILKKVKSHLEIIQLGESISRIRRSQNGDLIEVTVKKAVRGPRKTVAITGFARICKQRFRKHMEAWKWQL